MEIKKQYKIGKDSRNKCVSLISINRVSEGLHASLTFRQTLLKPWRRIYILIIVSSPLFNMYLMKDVGVTTGSNKIQII